MNESQTPQPAPADDGGPAFPMPSYLAEAGSQYLNKSGASEEAVEHFANQACGMSLRDYFAARAGETDIAVQAEIIRAQLLAAGKLGILPDDYRVIARYMHADAMLKARGGAA